ncbi:hypothetical protein [Desulfuromonas thiophila]|uniref:hypothetical protein n=1 Tax=Desulfuromonas thiophila TaxID=57664 RepID=UPI0029F5876E|nr:hypothetical protein [Desulfuromonas thiophila]
MNKPQPKPAPTPASNAQAAAPHQQTKAPQSPWFAAKRYGIGWGLPITWQGWLVLGGYLALLLAGGAVVEIASHPWRLPFFLLYVLLLSALLCYICYKKGEKFALRWGGKP